MRHVLSMEQIVITFAFLGALFVHISAYPIPPITVSAYDDNYYKIRIPDEDGITKVTFYLNLNKPLQTTDQAEYISSSEKSDKTAVDEWSNVTCWPDYPIKKGDVLNYIASVKKNGVVYTSEPGSFEVKGPPVHSRKHPSSILISKSAWTDSVTRQHTIANSGIFIYGKLFSASFYVE